jgi:hypothetical protein
VTGYGLDDPGFDSRWEEENFMFFKTLKQPLGSTQPLIACVKGGYFPESEAAAV